MRMHQTQEEGGRAEYAGHYEVLHEVSRVVEGGALKSSLGPHSTRGVGRRGGGARAMKIYPPRSLVVLPSCPADVVLYLTVSKVINNMLSHMLTSTYMSVPLSDNQ